MAGNKCEYCNVSANANCHAHKHGCPYACHTSKPEVKPPLGSLPLEITTDIVVVTITVLLSLVVYKFIKRKRT